MVSAPAQTGSSPLAGRRLPPQGRRDGRGGLIPARGETTPPLRCRRTWSRAHPRSRGDDVGTNEDDPQHPGSSPLAGRRLVAVGGGGVGLGLIPARGETTARGTPDRCRGRAHPRSRGDDDEIWGRNRLFYGSSPLAGRRPTLPVGTVSGQGLIPARGETTKPLAATSRSRGAHPRSRGDDASTRGDHPRRRGSSPLAGRRRPRRPGRRRGRGLIPARGETTPGRSPGSGRPRAHPRSRGDDARRDAPAPGAAGSSPLAGRRLLDRRQVDPLNGLIPARGETTGSRRSAGRWGSAHPRSRGDDGLGGGRVAMATGSSPLAGRRRRHAQGAAAGRGLIPARGETTHLDQQQHTDASASGITSEDAMPPARRPRGDCLPLAGRSRGPGPGVVGCWSSGAQSETCP